MISGKTWATEKEKRRVWGSVRRDENWTKESCARYGRAHQRESEKMDTF